MFDAIKARDEIIHWIRDYFEMNASPDTNAILGISGGKDSTIAAALCVEALGKNRVIGVQMPQGEQADIADADAVAAWLGITTMTVNIGIPMIRFYDALASAKGIAIWQPNQIVTNNTPARIRMAVLYAVSAQLGGRVVNTCNLSEDWVGYSTKFGDSAGDFSPLSNLTVTEVKAVGRALGIPDKFIDKAPIDGLCGMTDEENLGFSYETLDRYIREGICDDAKIKAKIDTLHVRNLHKLRPMPSYKYIGG